MPSESERLIASFFHAMRSASKRKPVPGADRIAAAIMERVEGDRIDAEAERDEAERGWG
jgi:hypothetical protein